MKPKCIPEFALALLLATVLPVQANLVTNGDFEGSLGASNGSGSGGFGPFLTYNAGNPGIPGWTIGGAGVDVWTSFQGTGNNVIDLNALGPGSLTQTFATTAGQSYGVSFDLGGGTSAVIKSMDVNIFGADGVSALIMFSYAEDTSSLGGTFLPQGFQFVSDGSQSTIEFFSTVGGFDGLYIDNVTVNAVPVPPAAGMFGAGLLGLIGLSGRSKGHNSHAAQQAAGQGGA